MTAAGTAVYQPITQYWQAIITVNRVAREGERAHFSWATVEAGTTLSFACELG